MIGFIFAKTKCNGFFKGGNGPPKMMSILHEKLSVRLELFVSPSFLGPSQLDGETSEIFLTDFSRKLEKWTGAHIFQMCGLTTKYKCD